MPSSQSAAKPIEEKEEEAKPVRRTRKTAAKQAESVEISPSPLTEAMKSRLSSSAPKDSTASTSTARSSNSQARNPCSTSTFPCPFSSSSTASSSDPENRARIVDATEIAYRESGEVIFEEVPRDSEIDPRDRVKHRFSSAYECRTCHKPGREPEPRLFSFNNPFGACPRCQGFGNTIDFDLNLIVPDKSLSLNDGAIDPWNRPKYRNWFTDLKRQSKALGIPMDVPWQDLTPLQQEILLYGDKSPQGTGFAGIYGFFDEMERKKYKLHVRVMLSKYRGYATCPECRGQRLRAEARAVRISGKNICEASALTISAAKNFFDDAATERDARRNCRADS